MEDRKLVDFARWLNDHPGEWNLWPYLIPIQADRRDTVASMRLVMERIKNHQYDEFPRGHRIARIRTIQRFHGLRQRWRA